jgi:hypothetical protein
LLPVVAGLVPFLGLHHFSDERQWLTVATTALIGLIGHMRAYVRHHRHVGPGLLFVAGLGTIVVTRLSGTESVIEPVALGLGGLFAAGAHWMNLRLCRCCDTCVNQDALSRWSADTSLVLAGTPLSSRAAGTPPPPQLLSAFALRDGSRLSLARAAALEDSLSSRRPPAPES